MDLKEISEWQCEQLSGTIAETIGLHFPRDRWPELRRGVAAAVSAAGRQDAAAWLEELISGRSRAEHLRALASHLTIGETYFFRDRKLFEALAGNILPALLHARRFCGHRLRVWSAGCCTGEEAYSLAIVLQQLVPSDEDWPTTVLATDINERFLQKAVAGIYGEWSFRHSQQWLKERYFERTADDRYAIQTGLRRRVVFAPLNLAADAAEAPETRDMDLILCRNVLMYFTQPQIVRVMNRLHQALAPHGWLAVSASEAALVPPALFEAKPFPGAVLYQKRVVPLPGGVSMVVPSVPKFEPAPAVSMMPAAAPAVVNPPPAVAAALGISALEPEAVLAAREVFDPRARALANEGKLAEALACCDQWLAGHKLDLSAHYLRATILEELGEMAQARHALQRTIYLDQDFVLGHFALGSLACGAAQLDEARRHFSNVRRLLQKQKPEAMLPESDGLTAGRLAEIVRNLALLPVAV